MSPAHATDREIWKDTQNPMDNKSYSIWLFTENSINMGEQDICVSNSLLFVLALFNVFCLSAALRLGSEHERRAHHYYIKLQNAVAAEVHQTSVEQGMLTTCPTILMPWLWRTSLGFFDHDEKEDDAVYQLSKGTKFYETSFPHECMFFLVPPLCRWI